MLVSFFFSEWSIFSFPFNNSEKNVRARPEKPSWKSANAPLHSFRLPTEDVEPQTHSYIAQT